MYIPPQKGRLHLLRLIRDIIEFKPLGRGTSIGNALVYLTSLIKKKAVVFLISDFLDHGFATALKIASRKHDLIAIDIADRREREIPPRGNFQLRDLESGKEFSVDFTNIALRREFQKTRNQKDRDLNELFRKYGIDSLDIYSDRDYEKPLFDLFLKRRKKFAR